MNFILPGAPWLIAHRSMLGVNKPYKITLNNCDYVLWQNKMGEIFALENVCPHMQAPLDNGWVCKENNSITCPFHALEFDGKGRLIKDGEAKGEAITKSLDLIIKDDLIWTYGNFEPRLSVPSFIREKSKGLNFFGVAGNKAIQAEFLKCIKINYDFNHQNGVHSDTFRIKENPLESFEKDGYYAKVVQTFIREDNTIQELFQNPSLISFPKKIKNQLEYTFPSTTLFKAEVPLGEILQFFILYPETENRTRTFVLLYANWGNPVINVPGLGNLIKRSLLKSTAKIVEQDSKALESLYPSQKPKIRLPKEEIMFYVEGLYHEW
ncbi:Rieske [2Fe-2S] domain-containing protein [Calothrix parasitica NIES-267]|uniref:Rieske [2Fe-2S] domain-containing protein n=1 Tax=Calothrix parasitica NIES-267 TaxID=1973488 RepID=A0A1Z4M1U8_9CYAN|nr:Rieske [2Fe-2S] domain-containing protein [Calothrix parasitica NIES-267]